MFVFGGRSKEQRNTRLGIDFPLHYVYNIGVINKKGEIKMIIALPKEFECSLEKNEIEIIQNCGELLEQIRDKLDACEYEYFHTSWGEEISSGELDDIIKRLADIIHIDKMY